MSCGLENVVRRDNKTRSSPDQEVHLLYLTILQCDIPTMRHRSQIREPVQSFRGAIFLLPISYLILACKILVGL
jgi:hypothetical protein